MMKRDEAWDALLGRYLAGQMNSDDRRLLNERLRSDPAARRDFAAMLNMDSALAVASAGMKEHRRAQQYRRKRHLSWTLIAATGLLVFSAFGWWMTQDSRAPFATVMSSQGADWSGQSSVRGKMQQINTGVVGFVTTTGNKVIVEGPATFRFQSAQSLRLDRGRVLAVVTPEGKGFTVLTPAGEIVDHGTEFGVDVDDYGTAEVQVYLGAVEVHPKRRGSPRNLTKGQALTLPGDGSPPGTVTEIPGRFFASPDAVQALRNNMEQSEPRTDAGTKSITPHTAHGSFCNPGGGAGLPGVVYDFKKDSQGQDFPFDPNHYFQRIKEFASSRFATDRIRGYFQVPPQQRQFAYLAMPVVDADQAPWTLGAEQTMRPTGWIAHYSGTIVPPASGEWRFVGYFDDALAVYINHQPVLDASRDEMINAGEKQPDPWLRQPFGNANVLNGKCYAGKWVLLNGPARIDIIVGERVGTQVGGLLMVENRRTAYNVRPDGTPILPLFVTRNLDAHDRTQMRSFSESPEGYQLEWNNVPVFKLDSGSDAPPPPSR